MKYFAFCFIVSILTSSNTFGQKGKELVSLRIGFGSTNIVFKEAIKPAVQFFGNSFNTGNAYQAGGLEIGISKSINQNVFVELAFSVYNGKDTKIKVNNHENYYTLKGFRIPLTANYLLRDSSKRFRINVGAGFQYLTGNLKQFDKLNFSGSQIVSQLSDINISEFQLSVIPGVQFRLIPTLFVSFMVNVSVSTNGRYTDSPCFSLKYRFLKTK